MASIRQLAECLGITGNFSVLRQWYGYRFSRPTVSLLTQARLLRGKHVDLSLIKVGIESFTPGDDAEIDTAVDITRGIYATVGLGIGMLRRFFITTADARGRDNIDDLFEAIALTWEWTVPNHALDIFFVRTFGGAVGAAPKDGSCDKDAKDGSKMNGVVVSIELSRFDTALTMAHEIGHYLGLDHSNDHNNLMFNRLTGSNSLRPDQGDIMKAHCFVKPGC